MLSLRASLLARHAAHDAELSRRRRLVLADLAAATRAASDAAPAVSFAQKLWRELFVAARPAWTGLACVWLLLLGISFASRSRTPEPALAQAAPAVPPMTWSERERALALLLAPTPPPPLPRSEPGTSPTSFLLPRRPSSNFV